MLSFDWSRDTGKDNIRWCIMARYLSRCDFYPRVWREDSRRLCPLSPCKYPLLSSANVCVTPTTRQQKHINFALCIMSSAIGMIIKPFSVLPHMVMTSAGAVTQVHHGG